MKNQIEKANQYYQSLYPGELMFYKLASGYCAFGEELSKVASLLGVHTQEMYGLPCVQLPHDGFLDTTEILHQCGVSFRAVTYFGDDGKYAIPDVERLMEEQEIDY